MLVDWVREEPKDPFTTGTWEVVPTHGRFQARVSQAAEGLRGEDNGEQGGGAAPRHPEV